MLERAQRYLETLGRIPTAEEYEDVMRMSRRGFFGGVAALVAAPYFGGVAREGFQGCSLNMIWLDEATAVTYSMEQMYRGARQIGKTGMYGHLLEFFLTNPAEDYRDIVENLGKDRHGILHKARQA